MRANLIKKIYRHDFGSFLQFAFRELYPHERYSHNGHLDVLAGFLARAARGEIRRLIINLPPRMLKSHCASVSLPAWLLGRDPRQKILCLHNAGTLGQELQDSCSRLMTSSRYRALFEYTEAKVQGRQILTAHGGRRQYMAIDESLTGIGANIIIIDDPISTHDAQNRHSRRKLHEQVDQNLLQRLNDKANGVVILVMQRLHEEDLTAHLLSRDSGWVLCDMPAIALKDEVWPLSYGRTYTRKKGEALHEARESREQLIQVLKAIGGYNFAYQYMQGHYKPRFGSAGEGGMWVTSYREGVPVTSPGFSCFMRLKEEQLMLPKIFGVGEDICHDTMRPRLTHEEFMAIYGNMQSKPIPPEFYA